MFQRRVLTCLLAIGVALLPPDVSEACLVSPPQTLWKLAAAETIVLARVTSVSEGGMDADLQVMERWKGTPGEKLLVREPPSEVICGIPPSFPPRVPEADPRRHREGCSLTPQGPPCNAAATCRRLRRP